ncbi:MAG TPA: hypothetical protein VGQ56_02130, partial [Gemmatimonadaceae bacterium]|nr:hypothetical protein [Gemmatimonadaceae bacterium]
AARAEIPPRLADSAPSAVPRAVAQSTGSRPVSQPMAHLVAQAAAPTIERASAPAPASAAETLDLNKVAGRWDAVVERIRAAGKPTAASALEHASPVAVTATGTVTIELDESNDIFAHAITTSRAEIVDALREWFPGVQKVELRRDEQAPVSPPKRLTDEMVRAERIASLRKRDPVLGAAIDALDLEIAD